MGRLAKLKAKVLLECQRWLVVFPVRRNLLHNGGEIKDLALADLAVRIAYIEVSSTAFLEARASA